MEIGFLSTHPATGGRRERVRELAGRVTVVPSSEALPDAAAWEEACVPSSRAERKAGW